MGGSLNAQLTPALLVIGPLPQRREGRLQFSPDNQNSQELDTCVRKEEGIYFYQEGGGKKATKNDVGRGQGVGDGSGTHRGGRDRTPASSQTPSPPHRASGRIGGEHSLHVAPPPFQCRSWLRVYSWHLGILAPHKLNFESPGRVSGRYETTQGCGEPEKRGQRISNSFPPPPPASTRPS